jgi:sec-independent protein translocase protein TatC
MTLLGHLEELRRRLIKAIIAVGVATIAAWFLYDPILTVLVAPLRKLSVAHQIIVGGQLIFTSPPEAFFVRLKVTVFAAVVIASPVVLWQVWRFITPGLYKREKRYAVPFVFVSIVLFLIGGALALYTLPQALRILVGLGGSHFVLLPRASEYLSFVLLMIVAFGVTFEFPIVLLALAAAGVVTSRTLRRGRKVAWIAILVVTGIITPDPTPVSQIILAVPLALIYEATILAARLLR